MKLFTFFLFITTLQLSAKSYSQKINLSGSDITLKQAFRQIEKQAGYSFFVNHKLLKEEKTVSFFLRDATIGEAMQTLLKGKPLSYVIIDKMVILKEKEDTPPEEDPEILLPSQPIEGVVRDSATGDPLVGVTIRVKGTTTGTVTDGSGRFSLEAEDDAVLDVSFVGYSPQEVAVNGRSSIDVLLSSSATGLDQLVVVGYGVQKKGDLTGSISSTKGEILLKAPMPTLTNALVGKMTGVISTQQSGQPGLDDPKFFIRGVSTMGDNSPLFLVDGVERSISKLDPNDIESITILKDAASAAIYGARGANGVILVTTKRGSARKTGVNLSSSIGIQSPTIIPDMMNAYEYSKYLNQARVNFGGLPLFSEKEIDAYRTGIMPSTDWWKKTLKSNAVMHQHSLTFDGGSNNVRYFISLGILNQDGLYSGSGFEKYNVRSNIDADVTKDFTLSLDVAARNEKIKEASVGNGIFSTLINSKPTERAYVPDEIEPGGLNSNGQHVSPIGQAARSGYHRVNNSVFEGTLKGSYKFPFLNGLKLVGSYSYDRWFSNDKNLHTPYKFYEYVKEIDTYSPRISGGSIDLYQGTAESEKITGQAILSYDATFADTHNISSILVAEQATYKYSYLGASRLNYISSLVDQLDWGPHKDKSNSGSMTEEVRRGYVGRLNYDYSSKYFFQFNFRYDGSFNFPPSKKWGFFPAVSAGWRISEEGFMQDIDFLHDLKLRASYGEFGNDKIPPFEFLGAYELGSGSVIGDDYHLGLKDGKVPNSRVTWENAKNLDIGLDFSFLNGKISGEFTSFYKKTRDILGNRAAYVPLTFGGRLPNENLSKVDTKGIEAVLKYSDKIGNVGLYFEGNVTWAKNKLVYMDEPITTPDLRRRTGRALNEFLGYQAVGLFQSQEEIDNWAFQGNEVLVGDIKYLDISGPTGEPDGIIDEHDRFFVGKSDIPEVIYGINLGLNYKGFDLTMNFQGADGFNQYLRWDPFNQEANALAIFKDSWSESNPNAKYPRLYAGTKDNNRKSSSFWLYNGSYLKLKNLEIAYTFSKWGFLQKSGIRELRIFASGNNLLTFSKMKDFDPETPNINPDHSSYYYPQMKVYNLGFNVQF